MVHIGYHHSTGNSCRSTRAAATAIVAFSVRYSCKISIAVRIGKSYGIDHDIRQARNCLFQLGCRRLLRRILLCRSDLFIQCIQRTKQFRSCAERIGRLQYPIVAGKQRLISSKSS